MERVKMNKRAIKETRELSRVDKRAIEIVKYIIDTECTVRQAAKKFGVCKTTVHNYCRRRILDINKDLYDSVSKVLETNKAERYKRGGLALALAKKSKSIEK